MKSRYILSPVSELDAGAGAGTHLLKIRFLGAKMYIRNEASHEMADTPR